MSVETEKEALEQRIRFLNDLVQKTQSYALSDPETALIHARKSAEAICQQVHVKTLGDPGEDRLEALIHRLKENRLLPAPALMPLKIVQMYGNFAAHARLDSPVIDGAFVAPCLMALAQLVNWYFADFLKVARPQPVRSTAPVEDAPRSAMLSAESRAVMIDLGSTTISIPFDLVEGFGDLLDVIWVGLEPLPPPFTYGQTWWLKNTETGTRIQHAREFTGQSPGKPVADLRALQEAGISPGSHLQVVRASADLPPR